MVMLIVVYNFSSNILEIKYDERLKNVCYDKGYDYVTTSCYALLYCKVQCTNNDGLELSYRIKENKLR